MESLKFVLSLVAFFFAVAMAFANVMYTTQGYAHETYDATGTLRNVVNISGSQTCCRTPNSNPICLVNVPGIGDVEAYEDFYNGQAYQLLFRIPN
jgi:hypothetical protein